MKLRITITLVSIGLVGCKSVSMDFPVQETSVTTGLRFDSDGKLTDSPEMEIPIFRIESQ